MSLFGRAKKPTFAEARATMVREQLVARRVKDLLVLKTMSETPREQFVAGHQRELAYEDGPLPIGHGQTISQPYTVAFMVESLQLKPDDRVLEVGTGCGYAAAVLAGICSTVHTIERLGPLAQQARQRLQRLGYSTRVTVHVGDGTLGLPSHAPFDAIVVAAGARDKAPEPLLEQLAIGGRLVIPIGGEPRHQSMRRIVRVDENEWREDVLGSFAFVPLIGAHGWQDQVDSC